MVSFRRSTAPSTGNNTPSSRNALRPSFRLRFWSLSSSNKITTPTDSPISPTTTEPRKPYVPRHAASDFSRNAHSDPACIRQRHSVAVMSVHQEDDTTLCSYNMKKERKRTSVVIHAKRNSTIAQNHRNSFVVQSNRDSIALQNNRNSAMFQNNRHSIVYQPKRASRQLSLQPLSESDDDYARFIAQAEFRNRIESRASNRGSIQGLSVPQLAQDRRKSSVFAQRIVEYVRPPRQIC